MWGLFRIVLEFVAGTGAFVALAGLFNAPVFPVRSYFLRAPLGLGMFCLLGQMLLNIDAARHLYGYNGETLLWMLVTLLILLGWAFWVWRVQILGFFYSFSPHPATDIVDHYVETNRGFDVARIKDAFSQMPADFVMQKVRARQADNMAEKLEQENELEAANEKAQRELVALRLARERNERLGERLEDDE
jgi:hypothetical protein